MRSVLFKKKFRLRSGSCQSWKEKAKNILIRSNVENKTPENEKNVRSGSKVVMFNSTFSQTQPIFGLVQVRPQATTLCLYI